MLERLKSIGTPKRGWASPGSRQAFPRLPARWTRLAAAFAVFATLAGSAPAIAEQASPAPATSAALVAQDARVVGDGSRTRFVMDLSATTSLSVFPLDEPDRVVIDLPEMRFALPEGAGKEGKGLISAFRFGIISAGKSRIVLDVTGPVAVDKAFVLPPADGQPAKLVVDLVKASRKDFADAVRVYRDKDKAEANAAPAPQVPAPSDGRLRVVLDPGHGGIDSGARAKSGTLEKDVVLAFAEELKKKLEASGRYEILMTRSDDTFVSLGGRVTFARAHHADLFVSIHADSFSGADDVRGATVYTLSERASDRMAAQIAESENKSDILAGVAVTEDTSEVSDILIDLARRETKNFAVVFARNVIKELKPDVLLFKHAHRQAGFVVLKAPDVPSALIELGYLSSPADEKLLTSDPWREKTANAMVRAIDGYFRLRVAQVTTGSITPSIGEP